MVVAGGFVLVGGGTVEVVTGRRLEVVVVWLEAGTEDVVVEVAGVVPGAGLVVVGVVVVAPVAAGVVPVVVVAVCAGLQEAPASIKARRHTEIRLR